MIAPPFSMDAYAPPEMAARAEMVGVAKASRDAATVFALAVLGGAFIALGANLVTVLLTGHGLGYGVSRVAAGLVFALGLMLVIVGGVIPPREAPSEVWRIDAGQRRGTGPLHQAFRPGHRCGVDHRVKKPGVLRRGPSSRR